MGMRLAILFRSVEVFLLPKMKIGQDIAVSFRQQRQESTLGLRVRDLLKHPVRQSVHAASQCHTPRRRARPADADSLWSLSPIAKLLEPNVPSLS